MGEEVDAVLSKDPKDRYVAFAFARGDVFLEIDRNGAIVFATGTIGGFFGIDADALVGKPFKTMVAAESAQALATILSAAKTRRRALVDITLQVGSRRSGGDIAGCPLPDGPGYYLSYSARLAGHAGRASSQGAAEPPRDAATGLLNRDALTAQAEQLLSDPKAGGPSPKLTMVDVSGAGGLMEKLAPAKRQAVQ